MLIYRFLQENDLEQRVDFMNNPLISGSMHYSTPVTIEGTLNWFNKNRTNQDRKDFVLEYNNQIVAMNGLTGKDSSILKAETYSFVNPSFLGMGYGTKALALQAFFAFYLWNLQKIWCYTDSDNKSSQHMHYKIGYIKEGELRNEVYKNGVFLPRLYLGLIKEDFDKDKFIDLIRTTKMIF